MNERPGEWLPGPLAGSWEAITLPCVYRITRRGSERSYLGSTQNIGRRAGRHLRDLRRGGHHNILLQRAWNKHGEELFSLEILSTHSTVGEARDEEQRLLDEELPLGNLYNIASTACGGDLISQHPRRGEIVARAGESNRLRWEMMSKEEREAISIKFRGERNPHHGKIHGDEARARMRENHSHHALGGHYERTPEHRELLSALAAARTGELNSFHGRTHSPEARERIGESKRGRTPVNAISLEVDGVRYPSLHAASTALDIPITTIRHRCLSTNPRFASYHYLEEKP